MIQDKESSITPFTDVAPLTSEYLEIRILPRKEMGSLLTLNKAKLFAVVHTALTNMLGGELAGKDMKQRMIRLAIKTFLIEAGPYMLSKIIPPGQPIPKPPLKADITSFYIHHIAFAVISRLSGLDIRLDIDRQGVLNDTIPVYEIMGLVTQPTPKNGGTASPEH